MPLYITDYLDSGIKAPHFLQFLFTDAAQVGLFIGLQAAVGSALIVLGPRIAARVHLGRMFTVGLILFGAGFITMALSNSFWGFVPAGIGIGGVGFANIAIVTMRQRISPPEKLGRVASASRTISWSLIPIGAALGGAVAQWIGLKTVYIIGCLGVLATAVLVMRTAVWTRTSRRALRADRSRGSPGHVRWAPTDVVNETRDAWAGSCHDRAPTNRSGNRRAPPR